jgi:hypothetical protein
MTSHGDGVGVGVVFATLRRREIKNGRAHTTVHRELTDLMISVQSTFGDLLASLLGSSVEAFMEEHTVEVAMFGSAEFKSTQRAPVSSLDRPVVMYAQGRQYVLFTAGSVPKPGSEEEESGEEEGGAAAAAPRSTFNTALMRPPTMVLPEKHVISTTSKASSSTGPWPRPKFATITLAHPHSHIK